MSLFQPGDLVTRLEDVFNPKSSLMTGVVTRVYDYQSAHHGYYPEVYAVRWDHRNEDCCGYLPHGLTRSEKQTTKNRNKL